MIFKSRYLGHALTHTHTHTRTIPSLRWTYPQAELSLSSSRHTLCTVTASCVCPHLFSSGCPLQQERGREGACLVCNKIWEAPNVPSAPCHSKTVFAVVHLPGRAPGGRRDADRCRQHRHGLGSEYGEWPPQRLGGRPSLRRREMNLSPSSAFHWWSPRPWSPGSHSARTSHSSTHTVGRPTVCIFDTHTGYCSVPKETYSAVLGRKGGTVEPVDWLGRSLSLTLAGSP